MMDMSVMEIDPRDLNNRVQSKPSSTAQKLPPADSVEENTDNILAGLDDQPHMSVENVMPTPLKQGKSSDYLEKKLQEIQEENLRSIKKDVDLRKSSSESGSDMVMLDNLEVMREENELEGPEIEPCGEMIILNKEQYEASIRRAMKASTTKEKMVEDQPEVTSEEQPEEMKIVNRQEFEESMKEDNALHQAEPESENVQNILAELEETEMKPIQESELKPFENAEEKIREHNEDSDEKVQEKMGESMVMDHQEEEKPHEDSIMQDTKEEETIMKTISEEPQHVVTQPMKQSLNSKDNGRTSVTQKPSAAFGSLKASNSKTALGNGKPMNQSAKNSVTQPPKSNNATPHASTKKRKYDSINENIQQITTGVSQELKKVKRVDTPQPFPNGRTTIQIKQMQQQLAKTPDLKRSSLTKKASGVKSDHNSKQMKENIPEPSLRNSIDKMESNQNAMKLSSLKPMRACAFCGGAVEKTQSKMLSCLHRAHNDCFISMDKKKKATCPLCNSNTSFVDLKQVFQEGQRTANLKF